MPVAPWDPSIDEENMEDGDEEPEGVQSDQLPKKLTPEELNIHMAKAESLLAKLSAMKQKYHDKLGNEEKPQDE